MKPLHWVGSSKKDLLEMPEEVQSDQGIRRASVLEVVESYDGTAYRAVYTRRS